MCGRFIDCGLSKTTEIQRSRQVSIEVPRAAIQNGILHSHGRFNFIIMEYKLVAQTLGTSYPSFASALSGRSMLHYSCEGMRAASAKDNVRFSRLISILEPTNY